MNAVRDRAVSSWWFGFGYKVKRLRAKSGITQQELADKIGLSRSSVANIESGSQCVLADTVGLMARALRVDVSDLIYWRRRMK